MTSIVPLEPRYTFSVSVPATEVPRTRGAIDALLVAHIARDLSRELAEKGYDVEELDTILDGSLITMDTATEPGRAIFLAVFPHPPGARPREMHPLRGLRIELVGGPHDGLIRTPGPDEHEEFDERDVTYHRAGYNLHDGTWQYQVQRQDADHGEKAGA